MCQQSNFICVERKAQDIYGNAIKLRTITHKRSDYKEYIISKEAFSIKRWLILMMVFSSFAFYCEFYNTDTSYLGIFLIILCFVLILKLHLKVKEESLLVIASLGLQLTTTFVTGRKASQFFHRHDVYDIVINEGFFMQRIIFYLAILLQDMKDPLKISSIVPLFQYTFPRLNCLEKIYNGVQASLQTS
ncbi:phosphatidylinositol N-acetylglucosaminyltransferase subunit H [Parasteatoda tepidariorum]|uniref:phosphatidylinositol N-acetylglucosaminyltransferase subunit H n=1 Tax=Parasteatoda tepidariorum TaxID=114398 RepID=UPI00077FCC72|nr:phosphatidylinositol N-acetylglucosaminyltransferase subunit H [Parasteatoda tepidariorum]XP_015925559.1 phosphatidylinositol N-acetylglucosaminyltransferase subunit H [Parasteatoda tepidariorum]XP_015925560.1 phosphatidylinositol N-acetylglucosaminyltransferase subunit H [Parasteatoda tepidariorum]XP_015925561.1 phosphatidylinositol N-acetylglucosaminyltransferase subunit H [Parasteatoda tepidariorum]XP_042905795.1 phosphatidylinositol N-acetylglucosaminyltransferase subunit H [Parasteatoda